MMSDARRNRVFQAPSSNIQHSMNLLWKLRD
jgi:hypothetical protein